MFDHTSYRRGGLDIYGSLHHPNRYRAPQAAVGGYCDPWAIGYLASLSVSVRGRGETGLWDLLQQMEPAGEG